jgi:hypothetical protein
VSIGAFLSIGPVTDFGWLTKSKYLSGRVEPDGTVLLRTADIPH